MYATTVNGIKKRPQAMKPAADEEEYESSLEAELRSKLELTRIVRSGWTTVETAVARTFAKCVYVCIERRGRTFVETIEHIEYLTNKIEAEPLAKSDRSGQAHIDRSEAVS